MVFEVVFVLVPHADHDWPSALTDEAGVFEVVFELASHTDQVWLSVNVFVVVDRSQSDHTPTGAAVSCDGVSVCHADHVCSSVVPGVVDVFLPCGSDSGHAPFGATVLCDGVPECHADHA